MRSIKMTAAAVLGLVALAGPAFAAGGYTVTANGATSGDWAYTAHSSGVTFTIHHGTDQVITCPDVTLSGVVHAGTNVNPVWTAGTSSWGGCSFNGQAVTITPNHSPASTFTATGPATASTDDHIAGSLSVNLGFSLLGGVCAFTVVGPANAVFNENNGVNQNIVVNETVGNLKVSGGSFGCAGVIANGDPVDMVTGSTTPFVFSGAAVPTYLS